MKKPAVRAVKLTIAGPRILVRPKEPQHVSGLVVTDDRATIGEVLAIGRQGTCPTCDRGLQMDTKVGDLVGYSPKGGQQLDWQGETLLLLDLNSDILFVVEHHTP